MSPTAAIAGVAVALVGGQVRFVLRPPARSPSPLERRPRRRVDARAATYAVLAAGVVVAVVEAGPLVVAMVAGVVVVGGRARAVRTERRRKHRAERDLPDAVERLILTVHAGLTPHLAVRAAVDDAPVSVRPAFDEVVHRLDRGASLADALGALPDLLGPRAAPVADAFAAADRYGLELGPMLDQLATDARSERRRLDEADARRLPVRLSVPLVLCTLPSFVLVAIAPAVLAALSSLGGSPW